MSLVEIRKVVGKTNRTSRIMVCQCDHCQEIYEKKHDKALLNGKEKTFCCIEHYWASMSNLVGADKRFCSGCETIKLLDEFGKNQRKCFSCRHDEYEQDKEKKKENSRKRYYAKKEEIQRKNKTYRKDNKEKIRKQQQAHYQKNKKEIKKKVRAYEKEQYKTNISFRLTKNLRRRVRFWISGKYTKSKRTKELLGCTIEELRSYLKSKFEPGMSWDNYGEWHIDHIIPCSFFDFSDPKQQEKCFHFSNLQPLWAEDNLRKSNKVPEAVSG